MLATAANTSCRSLFDVVVVVVVLAKLACTHVKPSHAACFMLVLDNKICCVEEVSSGA